MCYDFLKAKETILALRKATVFKDESKRKKKPVNTEKTHQWKLKCRKIRR